MNWDFSLVYKFYWHMSVNLYIQMKKGICELNYILSR